jgi:hypothetical protein
MYTDPERSHVSCNVSSLMGSVFFFVLFRQHNEGEEGVLYIYMVVYFWKINKIFLNLNGILYLLKSMSGMLHQVEPLK